MGITSNPSKDKVVLHNGVIFSNFGREKVEILVSNGDPNGIVTSKIGSLCIDYSGTGKLWQNTNDATAWVEIGTGGGGGTYTNASPTPSTLGGIPSGSTFSAQTMQQMFDALLYPYQNPAFTSFTSTIFGTYEVGQELTSGLATVNYIISNPSNISVSPSGVQGTSIPGATFTLSNPITLTGSGSFTLTIPVSVTLVSPGSYNVSLQGTNTNASNFSTSGSMNWRYRIFYGNQANTSLIETEVEGLANTPLSATSVGAYSFPAGPGTYKWICYPASMTTLTTFIDISTSFSVPFEAPTIVSLTNPYGVTANYNCHRSTNALGGAIDIAAS